MVKSKFFPRLTSFIHQLSLFDFSSDLSLPKKSSLSQNDLHPASVAFTDLCTGIYSQIQVKVLPRLRETWRVTWSHQNSELILAIPPILELAPQPVKLALLDWAILAAVPKSKSKKTLRQQTTRLERIRLEQIIREFLLNDGSTSIPEKHLKNIHRRNQKRLERMEPQGKFHNLIESFNRVNAHYFAGNLQATVTWASRVGGRSTHSLAKDGAGKTYHLITISQGYDHQTVTPEILDGVMYHECLHIAVPPKVNFGRRTVHGPEFKRREKLYVHFEVWQNWHRTGLPKSLRTLRRLKK